MTLKKIREKCEEKESGKERSINVSFARITSAERAAS